MEIKEYWPRYLQDVIEFDQIARAEQPEFLWPLTRPWKRAAKKS